MKFGIHLDISVPRPFDTEAERLAFDHAIEQAVRADALGFDYCWASERHFLEEYSHSPAPDVLLAAIAARTEHIRLGASVHASSPAISHPATIAERAAVLDIVSGGRVELALGSAAAWAELGGFGIDPRHTSEVWEEFIRTVPRMWMGRYFSHEGTSFSMPQRAVLPKPYQKPHPPLWAATGDTAEDVTAGKRGLGALSLCITSLDDQPARVSAYRDAIGSAEPVGGFANDQIATLNLLYCHLGDRSGGETAQRFLKEWRQVCAQQVWASDLGAARRRDIGQSPQGLAVGEPSAIIDTLKAWEATGVDCVNFVVNCAELIPQSEVLSSLELFATEVMPVFKRQRARAAAE